MAEPKKNRKRANIYDTIKVEAQLYRVRQDIGKLRLALQVAESIQHPQRYQLYQTYKDVRLDGHLTACIENRINMTMSRKHQFLNKDGSVNEEATKLLQTQWFYDYARHVLDSVYEGYSVIQFGDVCETGFTSATLIPRIYVKPERHLVTDSYSSFTGNDWREDPWKNWVIGVGDEKDLGLLKQASIYAIYKKNALGAWAEFCEVFGMPIRLGKTDMNDPKSRQNMENYLKNMGVSSWAVMDKKDLIEMVDGSRSDAFKVYDEMISRCNGEISKLIMGTTGVMDEKAYAGSANVHEKVSERYKERDEHLLENSGNLQLKPILEHHGFPVGDLTYKISDVEDIELAERAKIDIALINSGRYVIPAEYIEKTYGTPVELVELPKPEPEGKPDKITNELRLLYS